MGDPKKLKKKYNTPMHPWNRTAIETEGVLKKEYGLVNKREIYIASSLLKKFKDTAKKLVAVKTAQGEKEKKQLADKLQRYGLMQPGGALDDVLSLQLKDILERRIQTLIFRKGLARSMKQARQFILHRHIRIGEKEITSPSTVLDLEEESKLRFKPSSKLSKEDHPERMVVAAQQIAAEAGKVKAGTKNEGETEAVIGEETEE